jgi:hypothetical protein
MAKGKKNKANADFQKVKLKVGRKLKRDSNETKAEFKSRKIILKEIHGHTRDPITALAHHSEHISHHGKITLLNHFNTALTASLVRSLNKPIIDSLSKFIIDHSEQVRAVTYKCIKTCYNHMKQQHLSTRDLVYMLKPYLDCAFTHIDRCIAQDCVKFLDYLTNTNEGQVIEPLMEIVARRLEAGQSSDKEMNLAIKLKGLYLKHKKRQAVEEQERSDRLEPLRWTSDNYILDLDGCIHNMDRNSDRDVRLVSRGESSNNILKFLLLLGDSD